MLLAEVPWRGGVKRQWSNPKRRLSGISDAMSSAQYKTRPTLLYSRSNYLVPCRLSIDPKIRDLE